MRKKAKSPRETGPGGTLARMITCPHCGTKLYSTGEAAEMLGVSAMTVLRWARAGRFPHAALGAIAGRDAWVIPEEDVKASQRAGGTV